MDKVIDIDLIVGQESLLIARQLMLQALSDHPEEYNDDDKARVLSFIGSIDYHLFSELSSND